MLRCYIVAAWYATVVFLQKLPKSTTVAFLQNGQVLCNAVHHDSGSEDTETLEREFGCLTNHFKVGGTVHRKREGEKCERVKFHTLGVTLPALHYRLQL